MRILGAVLSRSGTTAPYAQSRPLAIEELELDPPGPTEALIRIDAAGICHSDLSVVDGSRPRPLPMLLGHEAAGTVVAVGSAVERLAPGQRVVAAFLPRCGACAACESEGRLPCTVGSRSNSAGELIAGGRRLHAENGTVGHHLGVSGFATHAVLDARSLVAVGRDVPADVAAVLGCAVLTGGGAVLNAGRPRPGQTIAIVGLGGVGMAALLVACSIPDVTVVGIDSNPDKVRFALELGADSAMTSIDAAAHDFVADVVVECAGVARAFESAVRMTAVGGRTVSVGLPGPDEEARISPLDLVVGAREIVGSYLGSAVPSRDIPFYESLWREGRLPIEKLISSRIALTDVNAGLDTLASGAAVRQIIEFPEEAA
jgi:alcohol dehydrogenase